MGTLVLLLCVAPCLVSITCMDSVNETEFLTNSSDPNKDMYVIHAMVYQVGILTNTTDNETVNFNTTGNQETLTFYHNNGSHVDLSQIPEPLLTNVTAQSLVGVAPVTDTQNNADNKLPWSTFKQLTNTGFSPVSTKSVRDVHSNSLDDSETLASLYRSLFKRDTSGPKDTPVAIHSGSAIIPQTAGVQSIAIPPLLTLNNNLSEIPVPIPNTSIVHYAKINTLVSKP